MSRKVFYSFHYERDAWRAAQVRNSNVFDNEDEYGVIDAVEWEKIERDGDAAIKQWIKDQLNYTSVTVVLIGAETAEREWVDYEIRQSWDRGNGLVGVRIHGVKNQDSKTDTAGANPFGTIKLADGAALSSLVEVHDWVAEDGYENMGTWVENAYKARKAFAGEEKLAKADVAKPYVLSTVVAPLGQPAEIRNPAKPWVR